MVNSLRALGNGSVNSVEIEQGVIVRDPGQQMHKAVAKLVRQPDFYGIRPTFLHMPEASFRSVFSQVGLAVATFSGIFSFLIYGALSPDFRAAETTREAFTCFVKMFMAGLVNAPQTFMPTKRMFDDFDELFIAIQKAKHDKAQLAQAVFLAGTCVFSCVIAYYANKTQAAQSRFAHWDFMRTGFSNFCLQAAFFGTVFCSVNLLARQAVLFMAQFLRADVYSLSLQRRALHACCDYLYALDAQGYNDLEVYKILQSISRSFLPVRLRHGLETRALLAPANASLFSVTVAKLYWPMNIALLVGLLSTGCNVMADLASCRASLNDFPGIEGFASGLCMLLFTSVFTTKEIINAFVKFLPSLWNYAKLNPLKFTFLVLGAPFIGWSTTGATFTTLKNVFPNLYAQPWYVWLTMFGVLTTNTIFLANEWRDTTVRHALWRKLNRNEKNASNEHRAASRVIDLTVQHFKSISASTALTQLCHIPFMNFQVLYPFLKTAFPGLQPAQTENFLRALIKENNLEQVCDVGGVRTLRRLRIDLAESMAAAMFTFAFAFFGSNPHHHHDFAPLWIVLPFIQTFINVLDNLWRVKEEDATVPVRRQQSCAESLFFHAKAGLSAVIELPLFLFLKWLGALPLAHYVYAKDDGAAEEFGHMFASVALAFFVFASMFKHQSAKEDPERCQPVWALHKAFH